ncbi:MAG: undecaprenyldiphospho-muramoylpentapeptide beta-N-acetylglucosaminyltransferase [Halanaerobiaceae bacterium]
MKAIITGGGTGGHIYPALAAAGALKDMGWEILYVGGYNSLEKKIAAREGIDFSSVATAPLPRKITPQIITSLARTVRGLWQSGKIIKSFSPSVILGTGGYVAGPVVLAGSILGYKTIIHEQNVYPGITNRILSRFVDRVALNFSSAAEHFPGRVKEKFVVTGNPVRREILEADYETGINQLSLSRERSTLLVFGGSQGAASINRAMIDVCREFSGQDWMQILYITGKKNYNREKDKLQQADVELVGGNIFVKPYLYSMEWGYAVADLVVSRAGATALAEITALGIPAVLIPYPYATGDHQMYNARILEENGAAEVIEDSELNGELLIRKIKAILSSDERLKKMGESCRKLGRRDARERMMELIKSLV